MGNLRPSFLPRPFGKSPPVVGVLRMMGIIGPPARFRGGVNLAGMAPLIEQVFKLSNLKAVALVINSPGGSPVQSALITRRIRALSTEKKIPVIAFAEDVAASGGYMVALAADEIYADTSSVVGSIGVISAGFGLHDLIRKLGVERRVHASGENKAMLDPFKPEEPEHVARLKALQGEVHDSFKDLVRERRGARLSGEESELFSGAFWSGARALDLGLIDGIGDVRTVMRERYGEKVRLKVVAAETGLLRRLVGGGGDSRAPAPSGDAEAWIQCLEARTLWSRYGL